MQAPTQKVKLENLLSVKNKMNKYICGFHLAMKCPVYTRFFLVFWKYELCPSECLHPVPAETVIIKKAPKKSDLRLHKDQMFRW